MTTVYFAGGEDIDFIGVGVNPTPTTTAGTFRSAYARCCLRIASTTGYMYNPTAFATPASFWFSGRLWSNTASTSGTKSVTFVDASGFIRLSLESMANATPNSSWGVFKTNSAGTRTQLGATFTMSILGGNTNNKIDINVLLDAAGSVNVYLEGILQFSYSGDTTTDGVTSIATLRAGSVSASGDGWSEIMILDIDTRSLSMQTLAPVANGNTHNFDTGTPAAANVNEITLSDATLDGSTTAGQIDQYTIPALASGSYSILAVGVSARMIKGSSGPSKMDLGVRSTSDYWSSDQVLGTFWGGFNNWWTTDPNTGGSAWAALPSNIGLKSVT